jgi:hypothetical protein
MSKSVEYLIFISEYFNFKIYKTIIPQWKSVSQSRTTIRRRSKTAVFRGDIIFPRGLLLYPTDCVSRPPPTRGRLSLEPYGVTFQKTVILIFIAMRTSNMSYESIYLQYCRRTFGSRINGEREN